MAVGDGTAVCVGVGSGVSVLVGVADGMGVGVLDGTAVAGSGVGVVVGGSPTRANVPELLQPVPIKIWTS